MSRFRWNPLLSKEYRLAVGRRLLSAGCTHPGTPGAARGGGEGAPRLLCPITAHTGAQRATNTFSPPAGGLSL